eukprot:TRINITY_DN11656_c0_g1_i1.p1 TRINITY_DN11656_c0_g1~~TRINITY_DN11656_c0_g1_i1.p1  ORF type:complete len:280 (-),score=60.78 TRINITY_DN11656_c0_g1_i1:344-1183(-)
MVFAGGFSKDKDLCAFGSTRRQTTVVLVVFFLMSIFAMYQCRQQFYGAVNSYVLWSESLGGLGLFFVAFGMFITQLLPIPFLFIGLCVTATFSLGFGQAFTPLCVGTLAGLVFTWCICHSSLRPWITSSMSNTEVMEHLHRELSDHHWKIVIVMRLSPIPIGFQNVMLSLVMAGSDAFWRYIVGSMVIIIPETFVYMIAGGTMKDISDFMMGHVALGAWERSLLILQIFGAVCFFYGLYRYGTRFIDEIYARILEIEEQQTQLQNSTPKPYLDPQIETV